MQKLLTKIKLCIEPDLYTLTILQFTNYKQAESSFTHYLCTNAGTKRLQ